MPFSYPHVGFTRDASPLGFPVNHHRLKLGGGEAVYRSAVAAVTRWTMYDQPITTLYPPRPAVEPGTDFAVVVGHFGFWSINPCRVVYRDEQEQSGRRFAFAIGTLPAHAEIGEERFEVEWRPDDSVWFDLLAYAGPGHWMTRLGFPLLRLLQQRFGREAARLVRAAAS